MSNEENKSKKIEGTPLNQQVANLLADLQVDFDAFGLYAEEKVGYALAMSHRSPHVEGRWPGSSLVPELRKQLLPKLMDTESLR